MADEKPVPETLETIADKIVALGKSIDDRFVHVDGRFATVDQDIAEACAQLGVQIEAVREDVKRVYDTVIAQRQDNTTNRKAHNGFTKRLHDHDVRILALERPKPSDR